ncbi:hypothetical protein J5X84_41285 [Streptosporangiaceae bacterium NEAU-GS5]|nr:hypothetical protein [Streptosporangiaceae bacterium NEAU-GS5]
MNPEPPDLAFAIGITRYHDAELADLDHGVREIKEVGAALGALGFDLDREPLTGVVRVPEVERYLRAANRPARRVVVYWTGHGISDERGRWLLTSDSPIQAPDDTNAISPERMAALLGGLSETQQILLILDCCGAGSTALDIAKAVAVTEPPPIREHRVPPVISLISATYSVDEAQEEAFSRALAQALTKGPPSGTWPIQKAMVTPQEVAEAASAWLIADEGTDRQRANCAGVHSGSDFFRNLRHDPAARDVVVRSAALIRRGDAIDAITGWRTASPHGLFLLTGSMGSGKSSVLTQLAADDYARLSAGPPSTVALSLTGADVQSFTRDLAPRLGLDTHPAHKYLPEQVVTEYASTRRRVTLLIDSADEARADHREVIVHRLLAPLSRLPGVHVVVADRGGARPDQASDEFTLLKAEAGAWYDLDTDPNAERDIARHVRRVLRTTALSPYADDAQITGLAEEIAGRCDGNFYLADLVADTLARSPRVVRPDSQELRELLRSGIAGAIRREIVHVGGDPERILDILTPLAWAMGDGVPIHPVWTAMANALSPLGSPPVGQEEIATVLAQAGSHVIVQRRGAESVHRLVHQAFADFLQARSPFGSAEVHLRICNALRPAHGEWPAADPYVGRHLIRHAEAGGRLVALFDDVDFMAYTDPAATMAAAVRIPVRSRSPAVELYLQTGARLHDLSPAMRAFLLRSVNGSLSDHPVRDDAIFSGQVPCRTRWTTVNKAGRHRLIRAGDGLLRNPVTLRMGLRQRVAVASDLYWIEVWDPEFEVPVQRTRVLDTGRDTLQLLASVPREHEDLLVVAYDSRVLEGRIASRNAVLWRQEGNTDIFDMAVLPSRLGPLIATLDGRATVLRRPTDGAIVHVLSLPDGAIGSVAGFTVNGRNVICALASGSLEFFDADTFQGLGRVSVEQRWTRAVATTLGSDPVLIGTRADGRLEKRSAVDGRLLSASQHIFDDTEPSLCMVGTWALAIGDKRVVHLREVENMLQLGVLTGHAADVIGLTSVTTPNGITHVVSSAGDGSLRMWG